MARPFRFTIILLLVGFATVLAAFGGWRFARASAPVNGPVILISIDTLRADHLPAYGYQKVKTPAIDMLAADGVVFERAYAHATQTLPSHTAILSGRLPFDTGVRDDTGAAIKTSERLLPQLLGDRGFATAGIVSSPLLRKETGIARGFDLFDGEMPQPRPDELVERVKRDGADSEAVAERWLGQQRSQRVFLFLHLYEPHQPQAPPQEYAGYEPYDGEIAYADSIVGRLIEHLKTQQLYDRSTIVLLSDHGEGLGTHGEREHGLFVYDESIHVPLIIKQAGGIGAGRRIADVVQHVDIAPTILDLAKAPIPGNLRGRSLTSLLEGTGALSARTVYSEAWYASVRFGWSGLSALTDRRYRYIEAPEEELYDLARDPGERTNLVASQPKEHQAMKSALDALNGGPDLDLAVDPKAKRDIVDRFRTARVLAAEHEWGKAIALLQGIVRDEPRLVAVWNELAYVAMRVDRFAVALDAYRHVAELEPSNPEFVLNAAFALLRLNRLDEARTQGQVGLDAASEPTVQAAAHLLLARIALARREPETARHEAELSAQSQPGLPAVPFIEGRLLHERGHFTDALPLFEETATALSKNPSPGIDDVAYYTADTLYRLERYAEAEAGFEEQLRQVPHHARARTGLAMVYVKTGRTAEAEQAAMEIVQLSPTTEAYALAARIWRALGKPQRADALRSEARRTATLSR